MLNRRKYTRVASRLLLCATMMHVLHYSMDVPATCRPGL
jgi:hypothetical protein